MHKLIIGMYSGFTAFWYRSPEMRSMYFRHAFNPRPKSNCAMNVYADSIHNPPGFQCVMTRYTAGERPRQNVKGQRIVFSPHLCCRVLPVATPSRKAITPIVPWEKPISCSVHPNPPCGALVSRNMVRLKNISP